MLAAGPPPDTGSSGGNVPPGLTRVSHIFHGDRASEKIVEHGPGTVPPPRRQDGSACPSGGGTDQCTTSSWGGTKWSTLPVEWSLNLQDANTTRTETDSPTAFETAFIAGSDAWENDPDSSFDATYLGTTNRKASSFAGGPSWKKMDGYNIVDYGDLGGQYGNAIAVVIYWYYTDTGEMVEADMRMNKDYAWTANVGFSGDPDTQAGNACCFDVQNIAGHEFGHCYAGLTDLYDADESELTMYGFGEEGGLKKRTLGLGDQLSIASAYPGSGGGDPGNQSPTANDVAAAGNEDTVIGWTPSVSDPESDPLTCSIGSTTSNGSASVATDCSSGTYTPNADYNGSDSFTYKANDGSSDSNSATVSVTINAVNDEPMAVNDTAATTVETAVNIVVLANDSDVDGDSVSVTAVGNVTTGASAVIESNNTITYTPFSGFTGTDTFDYTISDGNGGSDTASVTVTVNDSASNTMAVSEVFYYTEGGRGGNAHLRIRVIVMDGSGSGLAGATVTLDLYLNGGFYASGTGQTGSGR